MAKIYSQVIHGNGKNYKRSGRYADEETPYTPQRPGGSRQAATSAEPAYAPPRPKAKPGAMPESTREQMIATNNQRRAEAEERQEAGYRQSDRRRAAITTAQLAAGAGTSREQDRANLIAKNPPASAIKARPAVPVVQPAGAGGTGGAAGTGTATGTAQQPPGAGSPYVPPRLAKAIGNAGLTQAAHQQHTVENSPGLAGQPVAAIPPTGAELAAASPEAEDARLRASAGGQYAMQDADLMNRRMGIVASANAANYNGPGGAQAFDATQQANAAMANSPRAQQAQADRAAVSGMRPTVVAPSQPVVPGQGSLEERLTLMATANPNNARLQSQVGAVKAGQSAIDQGTSVEQQRADQQLAAVREQEVAVTAAANPPRQTTTGTATQPKPALPPEKAAKVSALVSELRRAQLPTGRAEQIQKEIDEVLSAVPKRGMMDMLKDMLVGKGAGANQQQPQPLQVGATVDVPDAPPGATAVSPDGKRFKVNGVWTQ